MRLHGVRKREHAEKSSCRVKAQKMDDTSTPQTTPQASVLSDEAPAARSACPAARSGTRLAWPCGYALRGASWMLRQFSAQVLGSTSLLPAMRCALRKKNMLASR